MSEVWPEDNSVILSDGETVQHKLEEILLDYYWDKKTGEDLGTEEELAIGDIEKVIAQWLEEVVFNGQ
jgi:hypothetical protein